jgi:hypothetical protein
LVQVVPALIAFLQFGPKDRGVCGSNALRGAKNLRVIIEGLVGLTSVAMPAVSLVGIEKRIQAGTDGDDDGEHASDDGRVGERGNSRASRTDRRRQAYPKMATLSAADLDSVEVVGVGRDAAGEPVHREARGTEAPDSIGPSGLRSASATFPFRSASEALN